jgi:hypothetical protein
VLVGVADNEQDDTNNEATVKIIILAFISRTSFCWNFVSKSLYLVFRYPFATDRRNTIMFRRIL